MKYIEPKKIKLIQLNQQQEKHDKALIKVIGKSPGILSSIKNVIGKSEGIVRKTAVLLSFNGDINATEVIEFGRAVSMIVQMKDLVSEVYIIINSGGGVVNGYGLLASEIERLHYSEIETYALIDQVAASGGYMAACVANHVVAAPFAYIGSIGVVSEMPNFNQILSDNGINIEQHTAGKSKRTVTPLGKITDEDRNEFKKKLERIHRSFINHVSHYRNINDADENKNSIIFSGDYWIAEETVELELGLVDEISTSQEFLLDKMKEYNIIEITFQENKTKKSKLSLLNSLTTLFSSANEIIKNIKLSNQDLMLKK